MRVTLVSEQVLQPIPGGIGTYTRALLRYLPDAGVEVEPFVARHSSAELWDGGIAWATKARLNRSLLYRAWERDRSTGEVGSGQVVHAPSLAFPKRDARPLVVTVHDVLFRTMPDNFTPRGVGFHEAMLSRLSQADAVIVPSHAAAADLRATKIFDKEVHVIGMGSDLVVPDNADEILAELGVEGPFVLFLGTIEPRKNPEGVVRGFVAAMKRGIGKDVNLYMAGPKGWWQNDLAEFVAENGATERIRRLEQVSNLQKAALYGRAQAFLFPSFAEGFGLPVLEAMSCGCPVVTSNCSSLPEVVGPAAVLCDPSDPRSIGDALFSVLSDSQLAADLKRLGRERAATMTWQRTARETAAVYAQLIA